jgi:hypothetical protein
MHDLDRSTLCDPVRDFGVPAPGTDCRRPNLPAQTDNLFRGCGAGGDFPGQTNSKLVLLIC